MEQRLLLTVATARSGTLYAARVWKAAGVDVQHEATGAAGCVSCFMAVDERPPLDKTAIHENAKHADGSTFAGYRWQHLFHQVRHPLKVIGSNATTMSKIDREWMAPILDLDPKMPKVLWCMHYTLKWNQLCEARNPSFTYQLEHFDHVWMRLLNMMRLPQIPFPHHVNKRTHASSGIRRAKQLTWDDLRKLDSKLTDALQAMALRYGYAT